MSQLAKCPWASRNSISFRNGSSSAQENGGFFIRGLKVGNQFLGHACINDMIHPVLSQAPEKIFEAIGVTPISMRPLHHSWHGANHEDLSEVLEFPIPAR